VLRTRSRSNQRTRPPAHESPRALGVPSFCVEPGNRVGESPEFQEDQQANYRATDVEPTSCETRVRNLIHTAEHAQGVSGRSCVFAQRSRSRGGRCAPASIPAAAACVRFRWGREATEGREGGGAVQVRKWRRWTGHCLTGGEGKESGKGRGAAAAFAARLANPRGGAEKLRSLPAVHHGPRPRTPGP
jgi:hypothetical protein